MLITIYDSTGTPKAELSPNDSSTQVKEIQGDSVLTLSFTHYDHISLDVDDYVDFEGERFWLTEKYRPRQNARKEWVYDIKLYGVESMLKRLLVIKTVDDEDDPVFTLTAPPREHVAMIVRCMNNGLGNITDWKVGQVDGTENVVIDYFGKYCDEALKEIAEKVGAEAWVEGQTVNICKCEHGEPIPMGYDKGLLSIDPGTADNVKFYTRLYPVGSSRNIDREKYGYSRLQLPGGQKYVEINADKYGRVDHYEQDAFADIYPRRTGIVSNVRSEVKTGEDGNPFTIYYFSDNSLPFDPNAYEIGGLVKRVSFQEGSELAGLGEEDNGTYYFEVNFNSTTREFEIITIWPYDNDMQLPGDNLVPKIGDKYILWNLRMPDEYYGLAEAEFMSAVNKYNEDHNLDISVYKAPTDHVWIEDNEVVLTIGQRIRLESDEYFPETGYRDSRITKITRKVNLPSSMDIEISDAISRTAQEKMSDSIDDVRSYAKSIGESTNLPDIIRSWDNTLPTDNNLFSSRRSQKEFLNKNTPDRAKGKIIFEKGIETGNHIPGSEGGRIDDAGNAELLTLVVRLLMSSPKFVDGFAGEGWRIWLEDGLSHLTVDKLTVRQIMTVFELLIEKIRSVGGMICVSAANGKIKTIDDVGTHWHIHFEQENTFVTGDLMRCSTYTGGNLKSYWVEVRDVGSDYVCVYKSDFGSSVPAVGDECVLMGNTTDKNRQNLILISATEDGQPRIDVMDGVHTTNFTDCLRTRLGNLDGITDNYFPADNQPHGNGLYSDNAYLRGTFLLATGEDIKTKFEIVEGKIESMIEAVRDDFVADKGYLNNPAFASGMEKWNTTNEAVFFLVGNKWLWVNDNVLTKKGNSASVTKDAGRTVVRIINKYILQTNANLRSKPKFEVNADGKKEAHPVYLSFFYRCVKPGKLTVGFEGVNKTGFENFNSFHVEEDLEATSGYLQFTCDGLWNGTGDFKLSFTGEIYLYMLVMSTDKVEALTYKYRTLFEQSEKIIKIAAQNFDNNGNVLAESGIMTTAQLTGMYAIDENGKLRAFVGAGQEGVKIKADSIQLEGLVTANSNFKILVDGSIETVNGKFTGVMNATYGVLNNVLINGTIRTPFRDGYYSLSSNGWIAMSTLGLQNNNNVVIPGATGGWNTNVVIPWTSDYNGFRAIIMNDAWGSQVPEDEWSVNAPTGNYFYEDGQQKTTLTILPRSGVEMIGYGEGETFKGWIILNRIFKQAHDNGYNLKVMFSGRVSSAGALTDLKTYNGENITIERTASGRFRVNFGQPFSNVQNYMVFVSGYGNNNAGYACVSAQATTYFDVFVSTDGGFSFMVINTTELYGYS